MVPAAIAFVHASVQCAAVKITTFSAADWSRLPMQPLRARFSASTMPRTEATFGYSLLTSCLPQVMAPALGATPTIKATTANSTMRRVLIRISSPCRRAPNSGGDFVMPERSSPVPRWDRITALRPEAQVTGTPGPKAPCTRTGGGGGDDGAPTCTPALPYGPPRTYSECFASRGQASA